MILMRATRPSCIHRKVGDLFQQPIETMANDHVVVGRLDVDIAGPALESTLHHQIDHVNNRRRSVGFDVWPC